MRESFELEFSPAFTLSRIPENTDVQSADGVHFSAEYHLNGNTLSGVRTLVLSQPHPVCTPQDYALRKPLFDRITQHLKSTLLYQQ